MVLSAVLVDQRRLSALIEEASRAICHALTILIWPIVTFFVNIGFVILGVFVLAHYSTLVRKCFASLSGGSIERTSGTTDLSSQLFTRLGSIVSKRINTFFRDRQSLEPDSPSHCSAIVFRLPGR